MTCSLRRRLAWLVLAMAFGCQQAALPPTTVDVPPPGPPWFEDCTKQCGIDFVHDAGPEDDRYFMPQIVGSGAALFDFDNDGRLDLYLVQNGGSGSKSTNRLFHQEADGRFTDVSRGSGLDIAGHGMGVAIGDVNNDGWPDVLVTEYGRVRLFLNQGNGKFKDISAEAGLDSPLWATSAAFFDFDRDGWLDLVVVNYVDYDAARSCSRPSGIKDFCGPGQFHGTVSNLYRNLGRTKGRAVRFQDVTLKSGLGLRPGPGLGVCCADFNGDGWPDIFVANDEHANFLWINQKDGTFKEEGVARNLAFNHMGKAEANMGVAIGDVDGDGMLDVFVTHLTDETNTLWKQGPRGYFQDRTLAAGLTKTRSRGTGFGTVLADFDHDGWLDLAVVNGRVYRGAPSEGAGLSAFWSQFGERNRLFKNDGTGVFHDMSDTSPALCGLPAVGRGLAVGDIDGDGALDLVVTSISGSVRLLRNVTPNRGHWLIVRAFDPALNRDAYGAEITVEAKGRRWLRVAHPASSFLCSNDPQAHFGLGTIDQIDAIHVLWPDGKRERFAGGAVDRKLILLHGEGNAE